jgi:hypothetical protein
MQTIRERKYFEWQLREYERYYNTTYVISMKDNLHLNFINDCNRIGDLKSKCKIHKIYLRRMYKVNIIITKAISYIHRQIKKYLIKINYCNYKIYQKACAQNSCN